MYAMENLVQQERRDSSLSMDIESYQEITIPDAQFTSNTIPDEDIINSDSEFPAPPAPAELEKLSMEAEDLFIPHEDPMITIPRTLRRANSLRQKVAARRIQRTWKHFYQEVHLLNSIFSFFTSFISSWKRKSQKILLIPLYHQCREHLQQHLICHPSSHRRI